VRAAFADGRIDPGICNDKDFDRLLDDALERPDDRARLADEEMGTIEDALAELEAYPAWDDPEDDEMKNDHPLAWAVGRVPVRNPFRDVGRNDPCPCGSGKKYKKCCLHL
jgi:uncharacterized protein YecA (UPF0149 family)